MRDNANLELLALLIGAMLPPIVAVIQQPKWSAGARAIVTVLLCLIAGTATAYFEGTNVLRFGPEWGAACLRVLVAAQATYVAFWKPTGIAPAIERVTAPAEERIAA